MSESLISGFVDPPIIFRGGDAFPRKPLDQKIAEILDSLSPMTWLTDNPERAERITQLGAEVQLYATQINLVDGNLGKKDLREATDTLLKGANQPSAAEFMKEVGKTLDKEQEEHWDKALSIYANHEWYLNAASLIVGTLGTEFFIKWTSYPEQATVKELFTSIFRSTEARTFGALSKFIRHQYSLKTGGPGIIPEVEPFPPGPVAAEEIKSAQHFKEISGATKNWEEARRIAMTTEREVAFGGRIAARIGGVAIDVVGGIVVFVAMDAIINACEKGEYIRMEHEACVSRLLMGRINDTYAALGELVESIETVQKLFVHARKPRNEQYQEHDLENAREQGKDMGERLLKKLKGTSLSSVYDRLHASDVADKRYLNDDLSKDELMNKTLEAVAEGMKKKLEEENKNKS